MIEVYIGKESNRLEDAVAGLLHDQRDALARYTEVDREIWNRYVRPVLKHIPAQQLAEQTGLSRRSIQRARNGHSRPRPVNAELLVSASVQFARAEIGLKGIRPPSEPAACLAIYLHEKDMDGKTGRD